MTENWILDKLQERLTRLKVNAQTLEVLFGYVDVIVETQYELLLLGLEAVTLKVVGACNGTWVRLKT